MKLFFILGNQLFPLKYLDRFKKDHVFFMAEDNGLCTYEKHHKQKILLFLSSMRSYADNLKKNKFKLDYLKIEDKDFKDDYFKKLKKIITKNKITEISSFEVEDKFFETKIKDFIKKLNLSLPKIPVVRHDERFTSKIASNVILESGVGKRKRQDKLLVDKVSATILLQSYLYTRNNI